MITVRHEVQFDSDGEQCAGLLYPGGNGACVVMGPGGGVTKEPGTDRFAARFQAAGYTVLAFDFRHLGASAGTPRQVIDPVRQQRDFRAALRFARTRSEVDPDRIALWGFSLSAGHLLPVAAREPVAAIILQSPFLDGIATAPNALRHETFGVINTMPLLALADVVGTRRGRPSRVVPLSGPRGTVAMLTTPDAQDADRALDPEGVYPDWERTVAARSVLRLLWYRPTRWARSVRVPALVVVARQDRSVLAGPARRVAARLADSELVEVEGGHYAAFLEQHDAVLAAELDFLARRIGERRASGQPGDGAAAGRVGGEA